MPSGVHRSAVQWGLVIRNPSTRPHPRRSRSASMAAIRLSTFVYQFTHSLVIDVPSISATPDFACGPAPGISVHFGLAQRYELERPHHP